MDEVRRLSALSGSEINEAKKVLAYEITALVHGQQEASMAQKAAEALFEQGSDDSNMPTTSVGAAEIEKGMDIISLLLLTGLASSKSDARRLIDQGGISVDGQKIENGNVLFSLDNFEEGKMIIKKGKKVYHKVVLKI